jgi:hypothetical protein
VLLALLALLATATAGAHAQMATQCAEWLSSGINDAPENWSLVGEMTETITVTVGHLSRSRTRTIGIYTSTGGQLIELDCDTYAAA